ncbi:MAG TPA: hemerythrin domain-containing protein [Legionella sp.]|nr:hemerythrin domain-containing protein [Legionella sp.]
MDIYDYLKMDHDKVARLFKQFNKTEINVRKQQIMEWIAQELLVHAKSEQDTFYKALLSHSLSKEDASHGKKEHKEIEDQIHAIMNSKDHGASWIKKVEKLQEIVEHHVKEEEHKLFKEAKKVLSEEEAYNLKEHMHYLKQDLLRAKNAK